MANFFKCLVIFTIITIAVLNISSTKSNKLQPLNKNLVSGNLNNINDFIKPLPEDVINFLKTSSDYREIYNDKKVVIYFTGADCPYGKLFEKSINEFRQYSHSNEYYKFHAEFASGIHWYKSNQEAQSALQFLNLCHEFCIVNPIKNEIFSIDGVGTEEAQKIGSILEQLKNW